MSKSHDDVKVAAGMLPKAVSARPAETEPPKERGDARGMIRQTLYMPPSIHDQFRDLAYNKRMHQQELFREMANLLFEREGLPRWEELPAPKKRVKA